MRGVELETVGDGERGMKARKTTLSKPVGDGDAAPNATCPGLGVPSAGAGLEVGSSI
jgi:hypothetical protein